MRVTGGSGRGGESGMLNLQILKNVGYVNLKVKNVEISIETDPETALMMAEAIYRSKIDVRVYGVLEVEKEGNVINKEKKRERKDWSRYISKPTLKKIENVMKELKKFKYKDLISMSGFSKTTVMRAIKVLTEQGKIKYNENDGVFEYLF